MRRGRAQAGPRDPHPAPGPLPVEALSEAAPSAGRGSAPASRSSLRQRTSEALTLYQSAGCPQCRHMGFAGRTGIHEIIEVDRKLEAMIHDNAPEQALETYARTQSAGILQSGRNKVIAGTTTLKEVLRVTIEE